VDELEELGVKSIEDGVWDCEFLGHISNPGIFMRLRRVYWGLGENEKGKTSWGERNGGFEMLWLRFHRRT
jgi:hypothetical protein